jgi:hypothetical protein
MTFEGIDYWAVFLAAVAGVVIGALWYRAFAAPWAAATGITPEMAKDKDGRSPWPYVCAFVAELVIAWALAGLLGQFGPGQVTLRNGVISGAFCWLGFVVTTKAVNYTFTRRDVRLILIDSGYWLVALVAMGAIIGGMGLR